MYYTPSNWKPEDLLKEVGFTECKIRGYEITEERLREMGYIKKKITKCKRLHAFTDHGFINMHADKEYVKGVHSTEAGHWLVQLFMSEVKKIDTRASAPSGTITI